MKYTVLSAAVVGATALACGASNGDGGQDSIPAAAAVQPNGAEQAPAYAPAVLRERAPVSRSEEDSLFNAAARSAWAQIDRHYYPHTGLVSAQPTWAYPTAWDIASALASYYSARGLGLISDADYKRRASRLLETLKNARLYNGIAYGRNYDANTGELVGPDQKPHANGTGYSAIDVGRLLVILAIVAKQDSELADAAKAVATRIDAKRALRDGYLLGEELSKKTGKVNKYQEGRLGYEQYAASGYSLWGMRVDKALDIKTKARIDSVFGVPITADKRRLDRLTSEPFVMHGLELGWNDEMRELAWQTLSAQAARFAKTGQVTIVSEDAINQPPYYFYYYCVYCSGKAFIINVHSPGVELDAPRWVSTKAAFGWHALLPSKYTWQALQTVQPALDPKSGWASGVFERSGMSTGTYSLNTAAIILESALYRKTGKPLMAQAR